MANEDMEKQLAHAEGVQEDEQRRAVDFSTEIKELKDDVRETLHLVRLLASLVQMPAPGAAEENSAIEFETRLGAMLAKHPGVRHLSKQKDGLEGNILV
jgi:hypothetical protein